MGVTTDDALNCNCGVTIGSGDDVMKFVVGSVTK